jgi:hypothetical protein
LEKPQRNWFSNTSRWLRHSRGRQRRCDAGEQVEYKTHPSFGHVDVVGEDYPMIPDLLAWTQERLEGNPATSTC